MKIENLQLPERCRSKRTRTRCGWDSRAPRLMDWLPNMDLNHDKQIQSLLCYHYTIRQASKKIAGLAGASRRLGK